MKKVIYALLSSGMVFTPVLVFGAANLSAISDLVTQFALIVAKVIPIVFALAIIYFFWGLIKLIRAAGDPKAASEGKSIMIYGVIAITIMVSIYGLVGWLQDSFGISPTATIILPTVPGLGL